ncbi:LysR family transcriptional regulator [Aggregatibacter kilianii]|uniref:LysR family transcriptional regulator n=1 Tax=Aggregatibacter kilianii TaxID=2025884 RepID=UPI000D642538|nr:LysR family transcriptional regulator [Aggregatibacter kilianii]
MQDFSCIKEFLATVELGSFSAAAEKLGLTGSAVGKSISRLEKRLNTQLFHRSTRKITLTSEGEVWLAACKRMMEELVQAEQLLSNEQQEPIGRVRVDLPTTYGRQYVLPKLLALGQRYPRLKFDLVFQDRNVDMIAEGVDIAVRFGELGDLADIIAKPIGHSQMMICASPDYLAKHGKPQTPDDLTQHSAITGGQSERVWWLKNRNGEAQAFPIQAAHQTNDGDARLQMTLAGYGLAMLPDWLFQPYIDSGEAVQVLADFMPPPVPISVLWQKKQHLQPKIRVIVEALAE